MAKPVVPRDRAQRDTDEAIGYYLREAGDKVALAFIDALERAYRHIADHPASGFLRYAHEMDLPDLRYWPLKRFPHLVFYVDRDDHVDVWRILHGERDMPKWLHDQEEPPGDRG